MADVTTQIRGQDVTLCDVTKPGYTPPTNGYVIELNTGQGRRFIRLGELEDLRTEKQEVLALRQIQNDEISHYQTIIVEARASRDEKTARLDELNARIDEIVAWLQSEGDPTSEDA